MYTSLHGPPPHLSAQPLYPEVRSATVFVYELAGQQYDLDVPAVVVVVTPEQQLAEGGLLALVA